MAASPTADNFGRLLLYFCVGVVILVICFNKILSKNDHCGGYVQDSRRYGDCGANGCHSAINTTSVSAEREMEAVNDSYHYEAAMEPVPLDRFQKLYRAWFDGYRLRHGPTGKNTIPPHWTGCRLGNKSVSALPDLQQYCGETGFVQILRASEQSLHKNIERLNDVLSNRRNTSFRNASYYSQSAVSSTDHTMLSPLDCHYFPVMACLATVTTLILLTPDAARGRPSTGDFYYPATARVTLRKQLTTKIPWLGHLTDAFRPVPFNWGVQEAHNGWNTEPVGNTSVSEWRLVRQPPAFLTYVHVIREAVVDSGGNVYSGPVKIPFHSCFRQTHLLQRLSAASDVRTKIDEVFVLSMGFARKNFYHTTVQMLAKATFYAKFLSDHPSVVLHVRHNMTYQTDILRVMGIRNRLITGTVESRLAYLPQGTGCAQQTFYTQHMSRTFQKYVSNHLKPPDKPVLLLIHRAKRGLARNDVIVDMMTSYARLYGYDFRLFSDTPSLPSFNATMELFYGARVIVAPHGAGLTNLLFSRPGAFLLEVSRPPPHMYPCYYQLAHALGLRYHTMTAIKACPKNEKCELLVDVEYVNATLQYVMQRMNEHD